MSDKCKYCERFAVAVAHLPIRGKKDTELVKVCSIHGDELKEMGYKVELI